MNARNEPVESRQERLERLISEGVFLQEQITTLRKRQAEVRDAIDPLFPGEKTNEILSTSAGTAARRVSNRWGIHEDKLSELQELLGETFDDFVVRKVEFRTTAKLRSLVEKADSELGKKARKMVFVDQNVSIGFSAATSEEGGD